MVRKRTSQQPARQRHSMTGREAVHGKLASQPGHNGQPAAGPQTIGGYLIQRLQDYGVERRVRHPGRLRAAVLRHAGGQPDPRDRLHARRLCRLCGRCLRPRAWPGGGLRDVLRRRAEPVQFDRRGVCREVAGGGDQRRTGHRASGVNDPLLHHQVRDFNTQREVFEKITVATASLDDPLTAFREIDRCLEAGRAVQAAGVSGTAARPRRCTGAVSAPRRSTTTPDSDQRRAARGARRSAPSGSTPRKQPVIIAGVEIHRFGLQDAVLKLAEKHRHSDVRDAAGQVGRQREASAVSGRLRRGDGPRGRHRVRRGERLRDPARHVHDRHQPGHLHGQSRPGRCIYATSEKLRIGHHHFQDVLLTDFVKGLAKADLKPPKTPTLPNASRSATPNRVAAGRPGDDRAACSPTSTRCSTKDGRGRRRRRFLFASSRPDDPQAHRIPQPGVLHVDGVRDPRGDRRAGRPTASCGRWCSSATARSR